MIEPSADLRNVAAGVYELYTAYLMAGFTESQAMELIKVQVAAMVRNAKDNPE
jgi:hypothetical protein